MKMKDKYKVLYEVKEDGERVFYVSEDSLFGSDEEVTVNVDLADYKLIYEKAGKIYGTTARVVSDQDQEITFKVDGESIFEEVEEEQQEDEQEEPVVETPTETPAENPTETPVENPTEDPVTPGQE